MKKRMVNMKTTTFEVMKHNLIGLMEKHSIVKEVTQVRTAKANTENSINAEVEDHVDVPFDVDDNHHKLKLKIYNTNCRIQIQHVGNSSHQAKDYLQNRCSPKYFAEEVILPLCLRISETISDENEKEFVIHLRKEIQRLKKAGKESQKGKKGRCVNNDCKSSNHLDLNNIEKYGTCSVCKSLEHYI